MVIAARGPARSAPTSIASGATPTDRARVSDDLQMASAARHSVTAPFAGVVVAIPHSSEARVGPGTPVVVLEAMKMEHEVLAESGGVVRDLAVAVGDAVEEGQLLLTLEPSAAGETDQTEAESGHEAGERSDLRAVRERHALGLDAARPDAVAKRRRRGRRTARENLAELLDEGTFIEQLRQILARRRRPRRRRFADTASGRAASGPAHRARSPRRSERGRPVPLSASV